jgi:hypothetical protein
MAVTRCGGAVPRPTNPTLKVQDFERICKSEVLVSEEEMEFLNGVMRGRARQPQWREAAARQRQQHVRQYLPTTVDYDPDLLWLPTPLPEAVAIDTPARRRQLKRLR